MDLSDTTAPTSDQQNYDDYLAGPRTVTVERVSAGSAEQPVDIHLVEFPGRPYRPSKSMRRVLVACWGKESSEYAGRRMTLYGDPSVRFGGIAVGGIKISHLSHLTETQEVSLTVSKGHRSRHVVEPLVETQPITDSQSKRLHSLFQDKGFGSRESALTYIADTLGVVVAWANLTSDQADIVLAALSALQPTDVPDPA